MRDMSGKAKKSKVIFLDRDGTINVDRGYIHRIEDWEFTDRAQEALKKLQENDFLLCVVTNQSGVGHGLYTEDDMHALNDHMAKKLGKDGISLAAVAYCPHHREAGCGCRKPKRGMVDSIVKQVGEVDFSDSWTVGDKLLDVGLGENVGTKTALIRSRFWDAVDLKESGMKPDLIVESLYEAVERIIS